MVMAKFPQRGSPGCVLLMVEVVFLVLPGLAALVYGTVVLLKGNSWGLIFLAVSVAFLVFAYACITETLDRDSYNSVRMIPDWDVLTGITPRERKLLAKIRTEIDATPSPEAVLRVLASKEAVRFRTANEKLQPISFALRPTSARRYLWGVILELLTWALVIICTPLLLVVAALDAAIAWDAGKGLLYKTMRFSRKARRYRRRPHNVFRRDPREPILYLRAFSEEYGERIDAFFPRTEEEKLAAFYGTYGPTVAIGNPEEEIPLLGAVRIYFADEVWQAGVLYLMSVAKLVVVQAGFAPGLLWELGVARFRLAPERLVISFAAWSEIDPQSRLLHYERFKNYVSELLQLTLPPAIGVRSTIGFGSKWEPIELTSNPMARLGLAAIRADDVPKPQNLS